MDVQLMIRDRGSAELARFSLGRLRRFAALAARSDLDDCEWRRRLTRHAAFTAFRDCQALGCEREAREILDAAGATRELERQACPE